MSRNNEEGLKPMDFFEIANGLLPTLPWFPRTETMAERVADLIVKNRFLVKYDATATPMIDAAILRNPDLDEDTLQGMLQGIYTDDYIILYDSENHPPVLASLQGEEADYAQFLAYEDCVYYAESELNNLLRFSNFDYCRYMLYLGAAFAIVRAEHPDWGYETFIECFRKDVEDRMAERTEDYLGYREYADEREGKAEEG